MQNERDRMNCPERRGVHENVQLEAVQVKHMENYAVIEKVTTYPRSEAIYMAGKLRCAIYSLDSRNGAADDPVPRKERKGMRHEQEQHQLHED